MHQRSVISIKARGTSERRIIRSSCQGTRNPLTMQLFSSVCRGSIVGVLHNFTVSMMQMKGSGRQCGWLDTVAVKPFPYRCLPARLLSHVNRGLLDGRETLLWRPLSFGRLKTPFRICEKCALPSRNAHVCPFSSEKARTWRLLGSNLPIRV